jgi:DNA mismatch repair protein MutS
LARLIEKGYHVAICEQVGDGPVRGLFPREVVRVVTPGTVLEAGLLPGDANNYLAAVVGSSAGFGIAYADVTTGDFAATEVAGSEALRQELDRLSPAELIHPDNLELDELLPGHRAPRPEWQFEPGTAEEQLRAHFRVASLEGFGLGGKPLATMAAGGILAYLTQNQPTALASLTELSTYSTADFMVLDAATRHDLELTETRRTGALKGSLLGVLDETVTPMGRRLLRQWLSQPGLDKVQIEARLDRVEALFKDGIRRAELRQQMDGLPDIERVTNRAASGVATPRDLNALRSALRELPGILETVEGGSLGDLAAKLDPCGEVLQELETALVSDPPLSLGQPGLIRPGYSAELDELVNSSRQAREWISGLETAERQRTGIKTLKVGYNKVFGYFIEVTKANSRHVPEDYLRKQTLINAERYFTPQMKEYESLVLTAEERIVELERDLFQALCRELGRHAPPAARDRPHSWQARRGRGACRSRSQAWVRAPRTGGGRGVGDLGGSPPGGRAIHAGRAPFRSQRRGARAGRAGAGDHRPEHVGQIDLPEAGRPDCADGPDGELRARPGGPDRSGRPNLHPDRYSG